ncbi:MULTISPECIES: tRNA (adenosine(37)-N6)-threonylcarbamoyltransferase complex ATPase subunit type 1 TsaE [unclassified Facklamia]|uniref:tRNA (adenosine(37)-N6)-threonylcarbamoyltransferase complex ATPase subunit type 1 TsaE n=1 Tax=Aerococcaceae TaxID=186827 RepID=UPI0013B8639A|nr:MULTISPECIES: tRNA (adenosine(37)-N6)-threonylcarbamoyltransferase complex ATPase subunit type 1 TsaE [unclassified Facklamia]NEW63815.1 tRNA (adenosine(37)-N6)-threonylcarbamoyltransferase complex ATPase subunit type 1 TsaE [Facklamia sp. 252]NEW67286.1 tRNA (adenosine(37)-N6)-threonylcarbamoyltransferase complex ATPase subunit type 1 TsaE [Facklamia sp. 253]QQD65168.1 tRNA (adenosine(37)-N6)-threonylcarbamoyltransferase complex ATPase subunit type 1 TsaE [Aerococcaceae bacterium zg-252]
MEQFYIKSLAETQFCAQLLAKSVPSNMVILLDGLLGSGKTTFTQAFGKQLGIQRAIKSPTYMIVKEYPHATGRLVHIDAYRLEDGGADTIDFASYLTEDTIIVIEWAQFLEDYLPKNRLKIQFIPQEETDARLIVAQVEGDYANEYQEVLMRWRELMNESRN